ncbi:hypothetical protein [Nocardioides sp. SR21]|uniref:hypothetical protein n=1 Tax=Nocardioides sp. SR21 TaxID=2919501 RepID=UPI001FA9F540|nr:hypothetical protein [Nocardioides sp. SR21]
MDTDIRDELDRAFDDGPPIDDLDLILTRGRDAVRRRRLTEGAGLLLVVGAVAGIAFATSGPSGGGGSVGPASEPTTSVTPSSPPVVPDVAPDVTATGPAWEDDTPVRYHDGALQIREGVVVHRHLVNPFDYDRPSLSDALDLTYEGQRMWVLAEYRDGGSGYSATAPSNGWASFADWVAAQVGSAQPGADGWPATVRLDARGEVVAAPGARILQRTDDPDLGASFAEAGTPTGAAVVTVSDDDKSYFVVWRVIDGELDVITTPPRDTVGATFDELLTYARGQYSSGEGLR